jgi:hypothetical protein
VSYSPRHLANENSHSFLTLLIALANRADWLPARPRFAGKAECQYVEANVAQTVTLPLSGARIGDDGTI